MHPDITTDAAVTPQQVRQVVVGTLLALFLAALDSTIVATALPPIARDLGDFHLIAWVVTAYLLTSTVSTPIVGKLSDLYGRRRMLLACLILFVGASALCALAPGMVLLIAARALQGIGGGGLMTLSQAVIGDVVPPRERGRYAGYFSVVWATASVLGPTLGGTLTERFGWPWIFWINLPLGAVAVVIAERALRILPRPRGRSRLDLGSIVLLTISTVALLMLLSMGGKALSWTDPWALALAAIAIVLGSLFAQRQVTAPEPILPPRFLADGVLRPMLAASFLVYGSYLAVVVVAPIYLQLALGSSVSTAGLLMIPLMLSSTLTANIAGQYTQTAGTYTRPPVLALPLSILGLAVLAALAGRLSAPAASAVLAVIGLGLGPTFPCSTIACQNAVDQGDLGAVSGTLTFVRALGGAILIAAASALVLGLAAAALPGTDAAGLEDLARRQLPPEAASGLARVFAWTFGALAAVLAAAWVALTRVEARPLRGRV